MNKKNFPVHLCWEATFSKKLFFVSVRHMLNVLWCVTQGFVIFIVFGCAYQVTPRHQSIMMCSSSFLIVVVASEVAYAIVMLLLCVTCMVLGGVFFLVF